ncbi:MAG: hypothetical protein SWY16_26000 [Cyanobacteriota bacterium]|nr:hypothetical protein [Cyanobacteriota bacterium]
MLPKLLQEFREHHPTGSLICELTAVCDRTYVVRAIVALDGETVATGFAGASTIEEAEDRARVRALDVLGLSVSQQESIETPPGEDSGISLTAPSQTPALAPAVGLTPVEPLPVELPPVEYPIERQSGEGDARSSFEPNSIESEGTIESVEDVEQLMNKTTIEIRRLGWSAQQGRRYLEQKYEKRSRQHLTREELVEFLAYLTSQPTPN